MIKQEIDDVWDQVWAQIIRPNNKKAMVVYSSQATLDQTYIFIENQVLDSITNCINKSDI